MGNEERRLIDANEIPWCHYDLEHYHPFVGVDKEYVDDMPTIDPESLRPKGRWEVNQHYGDYECSVCKSGDITALHFLQLKMNYCPNCGAKMEG